MDDICYSHFSLRSCNKKNVQKQLQWACTPDPTDNWASPQLITSPVGMATRTLFLNFAAPPLFCTGEIPWSHCGTQQGCPLGPARRRIGFQPLVETITRSAELLKSFWCLGNGIPIGQPEKTAENDCLVAFFQNEASRCGLHLNLRKCIA